VHIGHQCRKTTVISYHRCLINTGVEKMEQHLNKDYNFDHQMSLSKSKCCYHRAMALWLLFKQLFTFLKVRCFIGFVRAYHPRSGKVTFNCRELSGVVNPVAVLHVIVLLKRNPNLKPLHKFQVLGHFTSQRQISNYH